MFLKKQRLISRAKAIFLHDVIQRCNGYLEQTWTDEHISSNARSTSTSAEL